MDDRVAGRPMAKLDAGCLSPRATASALCLAVHPRFAICLRSLAGGLTTV